MALLVLMGTFAGAARFLFPLSAATSPSYKALVPASSSFMPASEEIPVKVRKVSHLWRTGN